MSILGLIGRDSELFSTDIRKQEVLLSDEIKRSSFLVLGGAGSIGQAVVKEIFKRSTKKLHVVDISENNLVELVREIRSALRQTTCLQGNPLQGRRWSLVTKTWHKRHQKNGMAIVLRMKDFQCM